MLIQICITFLFVSLLYPIYSIATSKCPEQCRCSADGRHVDCQSAELAHIPFEEMDVQHIEHLDMRGNALVALNAKELRGMERLHTLLAGHNQIGHLEQDVLDVVPHLRRLHLARNRIRSVPQLASTTSASHLHSLDLHSNQIRVVHPNAFRHLRHLSVLHLEGNFLQTLPRGVFGANARLQRAHLANNAWNCDCRIVSLVELLAQNPFLENHHSSATHLFTSHPGAKCANPGPLRHIALRSLDRAELKCFAAEAHEVDEEGTLLLKCDLGGMEQRELNADAIQWLYGDTPLEENPFIVGDFEVLKNGTLKLSGKTKKRDIGKIQCALNHVTSASRSQRNTWEHVQAQQAVQRVRASARPSHTEQRPTQSAPRFTYTPRDRRYREGTAVRLNCEAVAEPKPHITWYFNSRPIEASRKFELRNDGTQLVIYPFLEHDVGRYACEAWNGAGRVRSEDARLELIQSVPPTIVEAPHSQSTRPGQRVVFKCTARGEPRPNIVWFQNGVEIGADVRTHFQLSDDRSELSIPAVSRHDAGTYSCMAGNTVGSMTADARLDVESSQLEHIDGELNAQTLRSIVNEASQNIDRAISTTKEELRTGGIDNPHLLLRHFNFFGKQPLELARAREVYEESLRLIQKHVELGLQLRPTEIAHGNISYESVLSVTHIQTLMELSGCMNGQFKDACQDMCFHSKYRSYTGQCNNFEQPTWGVSQMPFLRLLAPIYENGFNTPVGWDANRRYFGFAKPNARAVSMELVGTEHVSAHPLYSSMLMQWGQFVDHDLDFIATALSRQTYAGGARCNRTCENVDPCFNIALPPNDVRLRALRPDKLPCIEFERSAAICGSGETSPIFKQVTYREQVNIITSYLDGSQIYGSSEVDALDLRDLFSDHGLLRFDIVSAAQKPYLPFERDSAMDCRRNFSVENPIRCFLSGDFRANEQVGLTAMHTIWLREHNRLATKLLELNADWDGERLYQETRKIVGAMLQHITYKEWLPKVLGQDGYEALIGPYTGYDPEVNPSIANAFATAAFRFGHTLINPALERLDAEFAPVAQGALPLHEAFFAPERLLAEGGVDPLLRGLFASPLKMPTSNQLLNKELTERLFHRAHNVSLDLAALNIQRGRDHGIPGYLEYRRFCNLTVPSSWEELAIDIPDQQVLSRLRQLYGHPGNIDLWVGGIVEKRLPDALVGPTFSCIIGDQFRRLMLGDRFWYENEGVFTPLQLAQIKKVTLAGVVCRNGDNIDRIQPNVFDFVGRENKLALRHCEQLADLNLRMWMSCCDETCASRTAGSEEKERRRKRSGHLYNGRT